MIKKSLKALIWVIGSRCPRRLVVLVAKLIRRHYRLQRLFDPNEIRKRSSKNFRPLYIKAKGIHGEKLSVDFNDHIGYRYFILGFFDNVPFEICRKIGFQNLVLIDIGSNVGTISIPIALNGARVVLIEPQISLAKQLIHNLCEKCGERVGTEVHHLQHQKEANENGVIKKGGAVFHKNIVANLATLCEKCHADFHNKKVQHRKVKTTKGTILKEI